MPSFPSYRFKQDITWWAVTPDGYGGFTFGAPSVVKGRWEEKTELFIDNAGVERRSRAIVYLAVQVSPEDYLYLGSSAATNPTTLAAWQVKRSDKTPDLRSATNLNKAYL